MHFTVMHFTVGQAYALRVLECVVGWIIMYFYANLFILFQETMKRRHLDSSMQRMMMMKGS